MSPAIRSRSGAIALAALLLGTLLACGEASDEDCDAEDLRHREPECGYYDPDGAFVVYPWIVPGVGGHPPKGSHPKPPVVKQPAKPVAPAVKAPAKPAAPKAPARVPAGRRGR